MLKLRNVYKLFTKEDKLHFHKICGIICLGHYIYRYYNLIVNKQLYFEKNNTTLFFIICHSLLSCSSLYFKISNVRIKTGPMIYPEFRMHSIIFAMRSLIIMAMIMFNVENYKHLIVLITMQAADNVTSYYNEESKVMRDMPYPSFIQPWQKTIMTYYYNFSQIGATLALIMKQDMECFDYAFLVLFPIQIAAFLKTMVRKNIISPGMWHVLYGLSLTGPYFYGVNSINDFSSNFSKVLLTTAIARFVFRTNKYVLWTAVIYYHLYSK